MSRSQETILTNICLVEDVSHGKILVQYRSPERNHWSGYAFPGGDYVIIMTGANYLDLSRG